jgi:phosphoribosylanthranilate isomerase
MTSSPDLVSELAVARVRTSVCANQTAADIASCVAGGVDAVGVLVQVRHRAEDAIGLSDAARLLRTVPPYVGRYAVTHATDLTELVALAALPVDTIQLHGDVSLQTAARLRAALPNLRYLKAVHVTGAAWDLDFSCLRRWEEVVDAFVLDSVDPATDRIGGTGRTHDWRISARIVAAARLPVVLAGGLTPANVAAAVERVAPWGVNVNSGVERDGVKDRLLVEQFVQAARRPDR